MEDFSSPVRGAVCTPKPDTGTMYSTALQRTVQHCNVRYSTVLYEQLQYNIQHCSVVLCSAHCTVLHSAVYSTVHSTVQYSVQPPAVNMRQCIIQPQYNQVIHSLQ